MGRPTRLEYTEGTSKKFWQVTTAGKTLTVTYGRIGTAGQTKSRTFATPAAAEKEAAKQTASKLQSGYTAAGQPTKPAAKTQTKTTARAKPAAGLEPVAVGRDRGGEVFALWLDGCDVWWGLVYAGEAGDDVLQAGGTLAEALACDGSSVERWRFASPSEAATAAAWAAKHMTTSKLKNAASADIPAWSRKIKKERPLIPRFELAPGKVFLTRDVTHPWLLPRPPATSFVSQRLMIPVCALLGAIDPRLGKHTGIYVSACPQALLHPYFEHVWEIVVQDAGQRSPVGAHFEASNGRFSGFHLSMQQEPIMGGVGWALVEHHGDRTTVGFYTTTHFKTRAAAEKAYADKIAAVQSGYKRVDKPADYYTKILDEITRHNRVPGQKPARNKLRLVHAAMTQGVHSATMAPSNLGLSNRAVRIGGVPTFCQEDWDYAPKNAYSKTPLLPIFSIGRGDGPQWSDVVNDGDAGTINIYAAPGDPFGGVSFSCS